MQFDPQHEGGPDSAGESSHALPGPADPLAAFYATHEGKVSDKWQSYLDVYSEIFRPYRERPVRILEIGIENGGSLEIWRRFFARAQIIVGCDINPRCAALIYDDPTIRVVIGDANAAEVMAQIAALSDSFDIIIDDSSHRSSDIVKFFALYFPKLAPGGLYVVEDLHCSYWAAYEGGLQAPYSSLSFFKRLSDRGAPLPPDQLLGYFAETCGVAFDPSALAQIESVCFYNSLCILRKVHGSRNSIGPRVVAGQIALIDEDVPTRNGASCPMRDEAANPWGPSAPPTERLAAEAPALRLDHARALTDLAETKAKLDVISAALSRATAELAETKAELDVISAALSRATAELAETKAEFDVISAALNRAKAELAESAAAGAYVDAALPELQSALARPWRNLWNFLCHHVSRALSDMPLLDERTRARLSLISTRHDPSRFKDLLWKERAAGKVV